mgnify:FL=1|jgi:hypothetical protein|tara:strand:- start:292 stop:507 length:216 start_codon:yes stop_codon:yes gene_type:complete
MKNKETQKNKVKYHLINKGQITSWEAIQLYGCTRLSDVILRLRRDGMNILTKYNGKDSFGTYIYKKGVYNG